MKKILVIVLLACASQFIMAQGYERSYNSECDCYIVVNHYDGGQISAKLFENKQGQKHGLELIYYPDGTLQYERTWNNGRLNGQSKHYFRNGKLYFTEFHNNGVKTGVWEFFDEDGDLTHTVAYSGKDNDGVYKYYHAGVLYLEQVIENNQLNSENVHNSEIYNALKEEYEQNKNAATKPN